MSSISDFNGQRSGEAEAGLSEQISLDLPADPAVLSLARLTVGVVAARADLGLEDVEDLRLAVEELCLSMWRHIEREPVRLLFRYVWDHRCVEVSCAFVTDGAPLPPSLSQTELPDELSRLILDALVDEHGVVGDGSELSGWVRKRRLLRPA